MSVSAPATRPPVHDSAVAIVSLRIRHRSSSERERARASLPLMLLAPGQADGGAGGGGDAFLAAGKTEPLADHGHLEVGNAPAARGYAVDRILKETVRRRALPLRVARWKMRTDIAV